MRGPHLYTWRKQIDPPGWERKGQPDRQTAGCQFHSAGQHPAHDLAGSRAERQADGESFERRANRALEIPCNPAIVRASSNSPFRQTFQVKNTAAVSDVKVCFGR